MSSSLALSGDMSPTGLTPEEMTSAQSQMTNPSDIMTPNGLSPIDMTASSPGSPIAGFDVQVFVVKNILILLVSHFMSRWLAENYPARGYMFYLTVTSTLLSILLW